MPETTINLDSLKEGMPALTSCLGGSMAEAGSLCFEDQNHKPGVSITINKEQSKFKILWSEVTDQIRKCWNDHEVTTEHGACAIAILLMKEIEDYKVIERSRKGTGFDYWLGNDESKLPFEDKARLEVSGIRKGNRQKIDARVKQKITQTQKTTSHYNAFVVVIEFSSPLSEIRKNGTY